MARSSVGRWISSNSVALLCASATLLSAIAWMSVTPPFQAPDEPTHLAYVQRLAETGRPPSTAETDRPSLSSAGQAALDATNFSAVIGNQRGKPPWTAAEQRRAERILSQDLAENNGGGAGAYSSYPPLYYGLAVGPYLVADWAGASIIGQLTAVRLLSCLLTALAAFFIFLFVRDLLPGTPLAAPAGALAVGLLPYVGFIGSSVNNDALLLPISACLFWLLARSFRRGLDSRGAAAIGLVLVLGWATKPTFVGLVPGALMALVALLICAHRSEKRNALTLLTSLVLGVALPFALFLAVTVGIWGRSLRPSVTASDVLANSNAAAPSKSVGGLLSYVWQYWLPRLPFMTDADFGFYPLWQTMFKGFVGRFGWGDYEFPSWLYSAVLWCWIALLALVTRALIVSRRALRSHLPDFLSYAVMLGGLLLVIGGPGYITHLDSPFPFEQARYLFPALALFGGLVGLAIRGAGARFGTYVAVAVVVGTSALDLGGLLLTLGRYYA